MKNNKLAFIAVCFIIVTTCLLGLFCQSKHSSDAHGAAATNPDARSQYFLERRGGSLDLQKVEQAKKNIREKYYRELTKENRKDAGINGWDDLGPKNIGGRIRAIAVNPSNSNWITIGAAAGGIWRSVDGGANWSLRVEEHLAYPVTDIIHDPSNSSIMYATTGEYSGGGPEFPGVGVLKSTNSGSSWSELPAHDSDNFLWLSKVRIDPNDNDIIYVAGSRADVNKNNRNEVLYRSKDQGDTWTRLFNGFGSANIFDLEMNPFNPAELVIGTFNNALISSDSGSTFVSMIGNAPLITTLAGWVGNRCEVEYHPSNGNRIHVLRYLTRDSDNDNIIDMVRTELWRSTNGGSNWSLLTSTQANTPGTGNILGRQGNYDNVLWVDPNNVNNFLMGGIDLWKYSGGVATRISNWSDDINGNAVGNNNSIHADQHVIVEDPNYNGTTNKQVFIGNDGGIYKTQDIWAAGQNNGWSSLVTELNITQFYGGDISNDGHIIVGGSQDNSYSIDNNALNGQQIWNNYSTGDGGYCAVNRNNDQITYTTTQNGAVYISTDNGLTYCNVASFIGNASAFTCCNACGNFFSVSDTASFIAPLVIDPNNYTTVLVGAKRLWQGTNNGANWVSIKGDQVDTRRISAIDIDVGNSNVIWVGYTNGQVAFTNNGGGQWNNVDANGIGLPNSMITDLSIDPKNSNRVMVTIGGYNQTNIYYTNNSGVTWSNRSLDFDMQVNTVKWHPLASGWVYVGTDYGIMASEDFGMNWSVRPLISNNEGPVFTRTEELVWQGDGSSDTPYYLCAFTHGRGLWKSRFPILQDVYVDKGYVGTENGTFDRPFNTFQEAISAAGHGTNINFKSSGTHNESGSMIIDKEKMINATNGAVIIN